MTKNLIKIFCFNNIYFDEYENNLSKLYEILSGIKISQNIKLSLFLCRGFLCFEVYDGGNFPYFKKNKVAGYRSNRDDLVCLLYIKGREDTKIHELMHCINHFVVCNHLQQIIYTNAQNEIVSQLSKFTTKNIHKRLSYEINSKKNYELLYEKIFNSKSYFSKRQRI